MLNYDAKNKTDMSRQSTTQNKIGTMAMAPAMTPAAVAAACAAPPV